MERTRPMKKRILVVDDEPALTRMIKLTLEQTEQYEVRTENLGRKAIEAAREFKPELILLDVLMPDMLGSEIAAQLEQDPELSAVNRSEEHTTELQSLRHLVCRL